jgi:hypothetical protein
VRALITSKVLPKNLDMLSVDSFVKIGFENGNTEAPLVKEFHLHLNDPHRKKRRSVPARGTRKSKEGNFRAKKCKTTNKTKQPSDVERGRAPERTTGVGNEEVILVVKYS